MHDACKQETPSSWQRFLIWLAVIPNRWDKPAPPLKSDLTIREFADDVRALFYKDRNYIRLRRRRWAIGATIIRLLTLGLSVTATIMLGLADLSGLAAWGFALSAVVTLLTALEPFFNFRSRWVSADEALARWHRAEEELTAYVATTPERKLKLSRVTAYDKARQDEWARFSQEWLSERRGTRPDRQN